MSNRALFTAVLLTLACDRPVDMGTGYRLMADAPTTPVRDLDVLLVVDDSGAMGEEQAALAAAAGRFIATLDEQIGSRPNLHIGVTSTNVGTGPDGGGGEACAGDGDDGRLLVPESCPALDRPFLVDLADPDDPAAPRTINYPDGQLAETLGCMMQLGTTGCGFEQPLEAMRRALDGSNDGNDGFLRRDAMLLVVVVSDEDDCSAFDREMYDGTQDDRDAPLGEFSSFRCFEFGVTCDQPDARVVGERTGCVPREDSPYLVHPDEYADFLRQLKGGPGMVMVAAITGDPTPVAVREDWMKDPSELAVNDLCPPDDYIIVPAGALPGIRTHAFLDALPRHTSSSICDTDMDAHLRRLASATAANLLGTTCLWATPYDSDDQRAGIQPVCRAELRLDSGEWIELPSCADDSSGQSCFTVEEDRALCGFTDSRLAVAVDGLTLPGERIRVDCLQARDPAD
jgi:hypothetical protein